MKGVKEIFKLAELDVLDVGLAEEFLSFLDIVFKVLERSRLDLIPLLFKPLSREIDKGQGIAALIVAGIKRALVYLVPEAIEETLCMVERFKTLTNVPAKMNTEPASSIYFGFVKEFLNTSSSLKRIYREVIDSYNNEIFTLCAAGLRAIIEGICAEEGIKDGPVECVGKGGLKKTVKKKNLEGKITGLYEKGILTEKHSKILHAHRYIGNEALHELTIPSKKELELAIHIV